LFCQLPRLDLISHGFISLIELPTVMAKISDDAYMREGESNVPPMGQVSGSIWRTETQSIVGTDDAALQR